MWYIGETKMKDNEVILNVGRGYPAEEGFLLFDKQTGKEASCCWAKPNLHNNAFTLIELLVVVLIIGILAAVAVPQYKISVARARIATILSIAASIANAEETYYLANGKYTGNSSELDIEIPAECTGITKTTFACQRDFVLGLDSAGSVNIDYCPNDNQTVDTCYASRKIHIPFRFQHFSTAPEQAGKKRCVPLSDVKFSRAVCSGFPGLDKQ